MSEVLMKTNIKREPKTLYFCGTSEDGFVTVSKSTGRPGRKAKVKSTENPLNGKDSL